MPGRAPAYIDRGGSPPRRVKSDPPRNEGGHAGPPLRQNGWACRASHLMLQLVGRRMLAAAGFGRGGVGRPELLARRQPA